MSYWLSQFGSYEWAGEEYAWLGWLILVLAAWGLVRAWWGMRWGLPLAPKPVAPRSKAGAALPRPSLWSYIAWLPGTLRISGLILLWVALMRPQTVSSFSETSVQVIDLFLCLDVSGSMQADDVKPNRVTAAKETLKNFVKGLNGFRTGLVVFAGKAFVQCPLSLDRDVVSYFIDQVDLSTVNVPGTAI